MRIAGIRRTRRARDVPRYSQKHKHRRIIYEQVHRNQTRSQPAGGICRRVSGKKQVYILRIGCPQGRLLSRLQPSSRQLRTTRRSTPNSGSRSWRGLAIPLPIWRLPPPGKISSGRICTRHLPRPPRRGFTALAKRFRMVAAIEKRHEGALPRPAAQHRDRCCFLRRARSRCGSAATAGIS